MLVNPRSIHQPCLEERRSWPWSLAGPLQRIACVTAPGCDLVLNSTLNQSRNPSGREEQEYFLFTAQPECDHVKLDGKENLQFLDNMNLIYESGDAPTMILTVEPWAMLCISRSLK